MDISEKILTNAGATIISCKRGETLFLEGEVAHNYFQIINGQVKLNNYDHDGKEFIQNIMEDGDSIGESILLSTELYPMNAIALRRSTVLKLPKNRLLSLLEYDPDLLIHFCSNLAGQLNQKIFMLQNNSIKCPKEKIINFLQYLKSKRETSSQFCFEVPFTRQQIANIMGLTVETVIRYIKILEDENCLLIRERKVFI